MPNPTNAPARDYAIGYGKPPHGSRFKPGQSGNPKGRPRRKERSSDLAESLDPSLAAVARVLRKKVRIKSDGRAKDMSGLQAMMEVMLEHALYGDARFMRMLLHLNSELEDAMRQKNATAAPDTLAWVLQLAGEMRRRKALGLWDEEPLEKALDPAQTGAGTVGSKPKEQAQDALLADDDGFDLVGVLKDKERTVEQGDLTNDSGTVGKSPGPKSPPAHDLEEPCGNPPTVSASKQDWVPAGKPPVASVTASNVTQGRPRRSSEPLIRDTRPIITHGWGLAGRP